MDLNVSHSTLKSSWITNVLDFTCRRFCDVYNKVLQKKTKELEPGETEEVTYLPKKLSERPLMLSDIGQDVHKYIKQTRLSNTAVTTAAATGFMLEKNKSALAEYGGSIKLLLCILT